MAYKINIYLTFELVIGNEIKVQRVYNIQVIYIGKVKKQGTVRCDGRDWTD